MTIPRGVLVATLFLAACSHAARAAPSKTNPPVLFPSYPVRRAFGPDAVPMTARQRAWIERILRSRTYRYERQILYFADVPGSGTPIVVYEQLQPGAVGPVIGAGGCLFFTPYEGLFAPPHCASSPKPVIP